MILIKQLVTFLYFVFPHSTRYPQLSNGQKQCKDVRGEGCQAFPNMTDKGNQAHDFETFTYFVEYYEFQE